VKKGSKLPIDDDAKLLMLDDKNEPREVNIKDLIQGKKVVIFGLPGVCGGKHVSLCACVEVDCQISRETC
jgi:peroxiredoxin